MQHKAAVPRDPTIPLVLGLAVVIAVVLLVSSRTGGDDPSPVSSITAPGASPSTTEGAKKPALQGGDAQKIIAAPTIAKLHCVKLPGDTEITAVSYNVKSLVMASAGAVASVLSGAGADVVLLQEMKNAHVGNQPAAIAGILGMHYAFAQNVAYGSSGGYGTAVLSRFPIVSADNTHLPRPGSTQQRGLAHVVIDVGGKEVSIYNTHLQNLSESARMQQIHAIASIVSQDPRPQIFGGDMNSQYGSAVMGVARTVFTDTWATVGSGSGLTHPASHLRGRIDYLMHANKGIVPLASDVLGARLSDHMAVRARYLIEGPGGVQCVPATPQQTKKTETPDNKPHAAND